MIDPVALTAELIRRPSVTPDAGAALELLEAALAPAGFACRRADRGGVPNLIARWGTGGPVLGFNGHVDVVPSGDEAAWSRPPFSGEIAGGEIWGRGAVDMKSGVAAFAAAAAGFVADTPPEGSILLLITGDEEGESVDGTRALLDALAAAGETLDACVVGEPTSVEALGDAVKIGRRGSMTAFVTARGRQGHTAYPQRARNPLPALCRMLDRLASEPLDAGSEHFEPSTLQITSIDVANPAHNVIPAEGRATLNIRFNDLWDGARVAGRLRAAAAEAGSEEAAEGVALTLETRISGESFLTPPGPFVDLAAAAVARATGRRPRFSTGGGTSDARFVKDWCPVVEVGLPGRGLMHAVDERVPVADVEGLARVYRELLTGFFGRR
jgi:succinyl-diaminopimelate desuccinylase